MNSGRVSTVTYLVPSKGHMRLRSAFASLVVAGCMVPANNPPPPQYGYQQPPPYGQQQYDANQQPFGAAAAALGPTSMGMQANVAAGLNYLFGWIGGLIFFLGEKQNRFVRFHAM